MGVFLIKQAVYACFSTHFLKFWALEFLFYRRKYFLIVDGHKRFLKEILYYIIWFGGFLGEKEGLMI